MDDFILTVNSDDEDFIQSETESVPPSLSAPAPAPALSKKAEIKKRKEKVFVQPTEGVTGTADTFGMDQSFVFDSAERQYEEIEDSYVGGSKRVTVDDIIKRRSEKVQPVVESVRKRKNEVVSEDEVEEDEEMDSSASDADLSEDDEEFGAAAEDFSDAEMNEDPLSDSDENDDEEEDVASANVKIIQPAKQDASSSEDEDEDSKEEAAKKDAFFAPKSAASTSSTLYDTFESLTLSRPILRAISLLSYETPTPIQRAVIPIALAGKDVVGQAVTGSGKTAAFILPVLERLLYRPKSSRQGETRVLVLCPTRELAQQCYENTKSLAKFLDIKACLCVGGLSLKAQEAELRQRPDIVIATPGRLIDHVRNSYSFSLDALDVLIIDEADRMLEDGFKDELDEIIKSCPHGRQTMLFSATMTDRVDELVRLSLNRPVRLFVDPKKSTARGLVQEFVRVKGKNAAEVEERTAILVSLCRKIFRTGVIIFLRSKVLAHRIRIIFGLLNMKAGELHGDLSQEQRIRALQSFKDGTVDYLMATDLASRGLDVKGVQTVINFDLPGQIESYLHRVGRTARAGRKGRAVTLVGEADRKMLKLVIKRSASQDADCVRHRTVEPEVLQQMIQEVAELETAISEVIEEEKVEKQIRQAEMQLKKGENLITHAAEIAARPARTWFQTETEKTKGKVASKTAYVSGFDKAKKAEARTVDSSGQKITGLSGLSRKVKRRKLAEEDDDPVSNKVVAGAIRRAKKASRPEKLNVKVVAPPAQKKTKKKQGTFAVDKGDKGGASSEGMRSTKGIVGLKDKSKRPRTKGSR